ncbi:hypothetical protein BRD56_02515 [Thermoplasmatales archaeon SW_10_69_26]|nr:MAG: hypothetical protein BRD56_02515 [Thermoplasmatales archaeon SW_10_69_26]
MAGSLTGPQARWEGDQAKAAGYIRYSTIDQDHERETGVDAQLESIKEHCRQQGHELDRVYKDVKSGRNVDRAEFYELLDCVADYDVLVTREISRFGRDKDGVSQAYLIQKARAAGVIVETTDGKAFDLEDRFDRAFFKMLGIIADLEVGSLEERVREGKREGAKAGYWVSGTPPTGYETEGPQGQKVLVPNENAAYIRQMFERYVQGESMRDLAAWFRYAEADLPSSQPSIGNLIRNPAYKGKITWKGEINEGQHDGIVSEALWEAAQDIREGRRRTYQCWDKGLDDDGENGSG